jgi:CelD/BcsL family acetyltransferase involved in cellulose biosynthesis
MYATRLEQLSPRLLDLWREILDEGPPEVGPFLHPEFVGAVAAVRSDIEVGVLEVDGDVRGFLPFQRARWGIARPVAGRLCDQSGAILRPGATWSPPDFARAVGLKAIRLANVAIGDPALGPYQDRPKQIHVIDISEGFESYREQNLASGSKFMRQIERRIRKAAKRVGPMRFVWNSDDPTILDTLMSWKAAQRKQTGTPNVFDLPWARALAERLCHARGEGFEGVLSAVYFGDTLAAAHLGIRTPNVLQYWVPGYNEDLHPYSPGLACLMEVAREAATRGIARIDLGPGEQRFKMRACNATRQVARATVRTDAAVGALLSGLDGVRSWARASSGSQLIQRTTRTVARGSYLARSLLR